MAHQLNLDSVVKEGIYTMVGGPNYETVAELKLLSLLGVDSVGKQPDYSWNETKIIDQLCRDCIWL